MEKVKITLEMYCSPRCCNCAFAKKIGKIKYCFNSVGKKHWIDNAEKYTDCRVFYPRLTRAQYWWLRIAKKLFNVKVE